MWGKLFTLSAYLSARHLCIVQYLRPSSSYLLINHIESLALLIFKNKCDRDTVPCSPISYVEVLIGGIVRLGDMQVLQGSRGELPPVS